MPDEHLAHGEFTPPPPSVRGWTNVTLSVHQTT
jgi:hypothetical protein